MWVLVADGQRGRILNRVSQQTLEPLLEKFHTEVPHLDNKQVGRSFDSFGYGRHKMEPRTDWLHYERNIFAQEMIRLLEDAAQQGKFDRLVLIAPPATLGDLRSHMSKQMQARVIAEIHKDLTHQEPNAIAKILVDENIGFLN